ncbi:MAG: hypothetical protein AB2L20_28905 [Mangrovibacterium sp.]
MTVAELIQQLQTLPSEIRVVVSGYEDGYNDLLQLKIVKIKPNVDAYWFDGMFFRPTVWEASSV